MANNLWLRAPGGVKFARPHRRYAARYDALCEVNVDRRVSIPFGVVWASVWASDGLRCGPAHRACVRSCHATELRHRKANKYGPLIQPGPLANTCVAFELVLVLHFFFFSTDDRHTHGHGRRLVADGNV